MRTLNGIGDLGGEVGRGGYPFVNGIVFNFTIFIYSIWVYCGTGEIAIGRAIAIIRQQAVVVYADY